LNLLIRRHLKIDHHFSGFFLQAEPRPNDPADSRICRRSVS
jgi:hypothetical protein